MTRDRVARVLAMLDAKHANGGLNPEETKAREAATLRLYGAGTSPLKFARLAAQQVDGVLRGQYRFAGAGQTGRMTSRGAQIQNLTRDVLGEDGAAEAPLVDAIADGCSYADLVAAEPVDVPAARKLALIVRPALVAGPGKVFVWSDSSAIEARITPWLAASEGAEKVLDIFRANDSRSIAAGHLHDRRCRHPAQEQPERSHEVGTQYRQGGDAGARFRRLDRRAPEHGAELPHQSRGRRSAPRRRCLARGQPVGARVLGRAPRWRELRPVGRGDDRLGGARPDHHGGSDRALSIATTISAARCSWRCPRAAC